MAYCGPRGLALDEFLSWPESSQDAALEWTARHNASCDHCGTHPEDWDPAHGGSRDHAHAEIRECPGCRAVAQLQRSPQWQHAAKGSFITLAAGSAKECPKCTADRAKARDAARAGLRPPAPTQS